METTLSGRSGISTADLESALISALERGGKPLTAANLRKELPKAFQRKPPELASVLDRLVTERRVFKLGTGKSPAYARQDPAVVAEQWLLARLERGATFEKALADELKVKVPGFKLKPLLAQLATDQRLHARYKLGKNGNPTKTVESYALGPPPPPPRLPEPEDVILAALERGPMKVGELKKLVKAKVRGLADAAYNGALSTLAATRRVFPHRAVKAGVPSGKPTMYALSPEPVPDARAFVTSLKAELDAAVKAARLFGVAPAAVLAALIEESGLDASAVWAELSAAAGVSANGTGNSRAAAAASGGALPPKATPRADTRRDREAVLTALRALIARERSGALIPIRRLRGALDLEPARFDASVLELGEAGAVILHHHDYPGGLPQGERAELVRDAHGTYYVGIALGRNA